MAGLKAPSIGLPAGRKNASDFAPAVEVDDLITLIERGPRLAWSIACECPCNGPNPQTDQIDPNCPKCRGEGVFYTGPKNYVAPAEAGMLTALHELILARDDGVVIRGVISRVTRAQELFDIIGRWDRGTMQVSVRPENRIGYLDRLVNLDAVMTYAEVVTAGPVDVSLALRYPAFAVTTVQSLTERWEEDRDFAVRDGAIEWHAGRAPAEATRLSVHYTMHPTWLVWTHPHVNRVYTSTRRGSPTTPTGTPTELPIQAAVRLEFLPVPSAAAGG